MAAAVTALFPGTQCGIGPATDEGFFYDFVVSRPFVPEDLEAIEAKMRELAAADLPYERQMWPRDEALAFFAQRGEPLKVQLIEEKTAGQSHVSVYTIKDRDTFVDFCVGPHVPSSGKLKAFKLLSTSNAYWKGDAQQRADAARLRHGVLHREGAQGAPHADRGSQEARPPQGRPRDRACSLFHPWAPGAAFWLAQGHDALQHARQLHARGAVPGRLRRGEDAAHLQQGALGDARATGSTTARTCSSSSPRTRRWA